MAKTENKTKKNNKFLDGLANFFALRSSKKKVKREDAIIVTDTLSSANECYNALKDNLLLTDITKNQVIQIESCMAGEGKTTLACNLAVSLSFNGIKMLVIDLDFRKPRVNKLFEVPNEDGLVDYMSDKIPFERLIKKTAYENVDVITRGSHIYNPSFLLSSDKFRSFIAKMRGMYDMIILDSPPILQISDYTHISKVADGVLFVVCYRQTTRTELIEAAELLSKADAKVIGAVMT
ncbi:MAG: CpsD/CapB family tyrosine-protein kinase, partial [Clostridia bacterium]|nr:CpsD/CapB family tyrosine-protein kinase [Clostridia bacterium]